MDNVKELISRKPKNIILADAVREQITSGKLAGGERLLSDNEFARKYGINERTVAAGLNILVREGLLERVPRRGTFVSKRINGKLLSPILMLHEIRSQVLNSGHPFYLSIFNTLNSCANQNEMTFQTFDTSIDEKPTTTLLDNINAPLCATLKSGEFSGLVLLEGNYSVLMDELLFMKKPYVIICTEKIKSLPVPCNLVGIDYAFAEATALNHLAGQNCKKVGLLDPITNLNISDIIECGKSVGIIVKNFHDDIDEAFAWSDGIFVEDDYFVLSNIVKFVKFPADKMVCMKNAGLNIPLNCIKLEVDGVGMAKIAWDMLDTKLKEGRNSNAVLIKPKILEPVQQ